MAKVRVFEAAKDHDLDVQDLLNALNQLGVKVRSHLSPVEEEEIEQAITSLGKKKKKPARAEEKDAAGSGAPKLMVRRRKKSAEEADASEESAETAEETSPEETAAPAKSETKAPAAEEAADAPAEAATEEASGKEAAEAAAVLEAAAKETEKPAAKPAAKEAEKPAAKEAEPPAAEAGEEGKKEEGREFGLKVVRFIRPEERPEAFAPAAAAYPMTKQEREAQKAERKAKKKRNKREERVEQKRAAEKTKITVPKAIKRRIRISEVITVSDLAHRMGVKATEVIKSLMGLGILATINQILDADTATLVAGEFGYEIENIAMAEEEMLQRTEDRPEDLQPRPPVITVMGHVDHGKTSLLDAIRKTKVAAGESGGITQHIGAYKVETSRGTLVFLDTPGHEAFTEMRARGAKATDIVVLVVAANDGVMPQTVEAIHHAKAAEVPIMVAVNKMDLPDANPDRVRRELSEHGLISEDWGGETVCVPVSAKQGDGIEDLLEMIALQAEMMNLQANPEKAAAGIVVEARLDRGRGPVATVLVQEGTLNLGDIVLSGRAYGRIRSLTNDVGRKEKKATPGIPVEITGLSGVPQAGDNFVVVETERTAKEISERRIEKTREAEMAKIRRVSLDDLHTKIAEGEMKTLCIIVKADVQGSVEAVSQSLEKLSTAEVRVNVIHKGVGGIIESDVQLAIASEAIIVGFHVRPESKAAQLADHSGVDIRLYDVIYDATDDVKRAMTGMLAPRLQEKRLGRVEVRQTFKVPKVGTVAGCYVRDGIVNRNAKLRIVRDNVVIYEGTLSSLKRFKDDVREVREGLECGLSVQDYNDLKVGDEIEFYQVEEVAQTL